MATAKKVTKKAPAKKATTSAAAKTSTPKKSVSKTVKKTTKKAVVTTPSGVKGSFRLTRASQPFFSFKITVQTVYWTILIAVIIFLQLWILQSQLEATAATDELIRSVQ